MWEICSKLKIKTSERRQGHLSVVFIVNFEQILHIVLVFPSFYLNKQMSWTVLFRAFMDGCFQIKELEILKAIFRFGI